MRQQINISIIQYIMNTTTQQKGGFNYGKNG